MTTVSRSRPDATEYAPFYASYIAGVPDGDIVGVLRETGRELVAAIAAIPEAHGGFRYAPEKWSVREVVGHLIDAERIFGYRALRLGRGDATPLPGFEENDYVRSAGSDARARCPTSSTSCASCARAPCACSSRCGPSRGRGGAW